MLKVNYELSVFNIASEAGQEPPIRCNKVTKKN